MATVLKTPPLRILSLSPSISLNPSKPFSISFSKQRIFNNSTRSSRLCSLRLGGGAGTHSQRFVKFVPFASGETETQEEVIEPEIEDSLDGVAGLEDSAGGDEVVDEEKTPTSPVVESLQSYKDALANNDESKLAEVEAFFKSVEDEKDALEKKMASLSDELSVERERVLRISADFDNFRKRTERERLSLIKNAQGEVVETLLQVLDNFERAKAQIKVETEGEEKISNNYQSIYKQFSEILNSLGVASVETVGKPFDPLLHEAIMREDSAEFEEGVVIEEFRKGFKLGERLLRPAMVKVSAGPGPAKPEVAEEPSEAEVSEIEASEGDQSSETNTTTEEAA